MLSNEESCEFYTPSFEHKNEDFRKQSPLSFINHNSHRKRINKFKHLNEEVPFIGHLMVNNEGQQILQPMYPATHKGLSLPPPIHFDKYLGWQGTDMEEKNERKDTLRPSQYYPTCNCRSNSVKAPFNLFGLNPHDRK